jgi:uncharacterized OB-fold protein
MTTEHHPIVDTESEPFWTALGEGQFLLKWCLSCGRPHYYPRTYCPFCWGETEWRPASGDGVVFATTTVRRVGLRPFNERVPYNLSVVELAEGPRLLTNVVGSPPEAVTIDAAVTFSPTLDDGQWMPTFRLAQPDE